MSFILDALKKSETDRQRQNGPALFEVRVAPPKTGLPLWAIGLGVLLAVNLVIVAWVLLRKPSTPDTAASTNPPQQTTQPYSTVQGQGYAGQQQGYPPQQGYPAQGYPQAQGYAGQPGQQGYMTPQGYPPAQQGYPAPGYGSQAPYSGANGAPGYPQSQGANGPNTVPVAGNPPGGPVGQTAGMAAQGAPGAASDASAESGGEKLNPDDYAPAADPGPAAPFANHVTRATSAGVPLYRDASAAPGTNIPQLRLDLHVFAAKPQDRFVMINMHKLHEGDLMPEGVRVEGITPEGAVLSKDGVRFLLPRD